MQPRVGVGYDGENGECPARDDDCPDLPGFHPPRVDEEELEVAALAQHPGVRGEHEVVLDDVEGATPRLQRREEREREGD